MIRCFLLSILALVFASCTTGTPSQHVVNGVTRVYTPKKCLGVTYYTKVEEVKTKEQALDDLEVEKEKREQELDLQAEERQSAAVFWIGLALMIGAPVCVIIGYLTKGWKFWGGMAVTSGALGAAFWGFESLIPYLKWGVGALIAAVVLWSMWKLKDLSILEKIRNSEPGKLF